MTKKELLAYQELLLKQKQDVLDEIRYITQGASHSHQEAQGGLSTFTFHPADVASDHYERELALSIATAEGKIVYDIDEALKRIEENAYGDCLDCGKSIPRRRLKAIPYTSLCVACQRQRERSSST